MEPVAESLADWCVTSLGGLRMLGKAVSHPSHGGSLAGLRASPALLGTADGFLVWLAEVVDGGVELPLAAAALRPTHAEPASPLTIPHLAEDGLDAPPALAVEATAPLGPQLAIHALARRHALRHAPTRRR